MGTEGDRHSILVNLAVVLQKAETSLNRSWSSGHGAGLEHCDEWCKLWMMLVGSWYSLDWALKGVEEGQALKLGLTDAHQFAMKLLQQRARTLSVDDINTWFCGFFLISAEHRIADAIDRLTQLMFDPDKQQLEHDRRDRLIYTRCSFLVQSCPHCKQPANVFLPATYTVLANFAAYPGRDDVAAMQLWMSRSPVACVYERVNTLKHKPFYKDPVADLPTISRWDDAAAATRDLTLLMQEMSGHWRVDNPKVKSTF